MPISSADVKRIAQEVGANIVGICSAAPPQSLAAFDEWIADGFYGEMDYMARSRPLRADPAQLLPGAKSAIVIGVNYRSSTRPSPDEAKIAEYARGRDYHRVLRALLKRLSRQLLQVVPEAQFRACVDSAPILEREYAHRAGLGWYGKNTMLINSHRGSWFFLGCLLTTLELTPDAPALGGCGTCRACIDACPTGAIVFHRDRWQVDARQCISYLTIEKRGQFSAQEEQAIGDWTFGCDVCQDVCPFNQSRESQPLRAEEAKLLDFAEPRKWPPVEEIANLSREDWDRLSTGSPVRRAGYEGLRRNAAANLRNRRP